MERSNEAPWLRFAVAALVLSPLAMFAILVAFPSLDPALRHTRIHFWTVGVTALAAAVACVIVVGAARSLRETRLLFLAMGFLSIGGIFSIHGLMTPGIVVHDFHASLSVSSWVSVLVGAVFVALSAVELPERVQQMIRRYGIVIFAWGAIAVAAYIGMSFAVVDWLDSVPTDNPKLQYVIAAVATALFAFGVWRYAQAYLFARLPSQAAIVVALGLLVQVPSILLWGTVWHLSWWTYHALYGGAFAVLMAGWAIEVRRARSLNAIAEALSMRDALAALNRGRDAHVLELVDAIEAKDVATLGHVSRVSSYALATGRRMGLSAHDLRALVLAAQMHDVGKIGVPDAILRKPARLTDEEFAEVQRHAPRGESIAKRVDALREIAPVIRAHHERLNGQGYPDGLAGDDIPLLARIVAVADTYDAMTSARPYRDAMSQEQALAEVRRVSGIELDPRCVDAFIASLKDQHSAAA